MAESHEASAATLQALSRHELPVETPSPATVLITKQEVVLGTKAAVQASTWWTKGTRFVVSAIGRTLLPWTDTRPRRHYPSRSSYLERSCMQREIHRL